LFGIGYTGVVDPYNIESTFGIPSNVLSNRSIEIPEGTFLLNKNKNIDEPIEIKTQTEVNIKLIEL